MSAGVSEVRGTQLQSSGKDTPGRDIAPSVIASGMAVGTVALMILGVQPVLLGALADAHRITDAELGPLATVEVLAIAAGSAFGPAWMRSGHMRGKAIALSLGLAVANMAIYLVSRGVMLDVLRGVTGLIEGVLMGATIVVTIEGRHPDRLNAIFLAVSTLPQAVMAFFLPIWIVPRFGVNGGFAVLAILSLLSAAASLFLVEAGTAEAEGTPTPRTLWSVPAVVALAAILLQNAAIGGAWDYVDRLASQHHFPPEMSGIAVSGGLVVQVLGALAAAAWGRRLSFRWTLIVGTFCQAGVIGWLALAATPLMYVLPALLFGLFWLAMSPFQVRLLIAIDPSRTVAMLVTAAALVGLSIGPSVSALGVSTGDVTGAFWIAAAMMLAALCLYAGLGLRTMTETFET